MKRKLPGPTEFFGVDYFLGATLNQDAPATATVVIVVIGLESDDGTGGGGGQLRSRNWS